MYSSRLRRTGRAEHGLLRCGIFARRTKYFLVILGLLTGGILTGQNLIRAAELRSVATELQGYQTAVRTFQDKYFALPGDMRNATDFGEAPEAMEVIPLATARPVLVAPLPVTVAARGP